MPAESLEVTAGASAPGPAVALEVRDVAAGYGKAQVLFDVTIRLEAGECVALLGANGAGKSTLLRAISGLVSVSAGRILLGPTRLDRLSPERIFAAGVSHVPEGRGLFPNLSVEDNILLGGYHDSQRVARTRMAELLPLFPVLTSRRRQLAGQLSGGEQQMVTILRALMSTPRFVLLDEPTLGLGPALKTQVLHVLADVARSGIGVLIVEQSAKQALQIASRCYVMRTGRVSYAASTAEALRDYDRLSDEYLGTTSGPAPP
jgi:branched-chain amino acid transport system ATP-binding protein